MAKKLTVVISGSFRRFFPEISKTVLAFESLGEVINPDEEFAILKTDKTRDPRVLE